MPIRLKGLHFTYAAGSQWARPVLRDVNLEVPPGSCLGILGANGSGKTTLIRHMNGLLLPQEGTVQVGGLTLQRGSKRPRQLSQEIGLVFQFPEKQLFAERVFEDVASGYRFSGMPPEEEEERVSAALRAVGLDPGQYGGRSPFSLTWGEKRKVALAGVIVLDTPRLVFDEPGAGLDPLERNNLLAIIENLVREQRRSVVFVSHHLDDLFRVADRLAVLADRTIVFEGTVAELCRREDLHRWGLDWPPLVRLMRSLAVRHPGLEADVRTAEEAARRLKTLLPC